MKKKTIIKEVALGFVYAMFLIGASYVVAFFTTPEQWFNLGFHQRAFVVGVGLLICVTLATWKQAKEKVVKI